MTGTFYSRSDQLGNAYEMYELYTDIPDPMMAFAATVVSISLCASSETSDECIRSVTAWMSISQEDTLRLRSKEKGS